MVHIFIYIHIYMHTYMCTHVRNAYKWRGSWVASRINEKTGWGRSGEWVKAYVTDCTSWVLPFPSLPRTLFVQRPRSLSKIATISGSWPSPLNSYSSFYFPFFLFISFFFFFLLIPFLPILLSSFSCVALYDQQPHFFSISRLRFIKNINYNWSVNIFKLFL